MSGHGILNYANNVNAPPPANGYATIGGTYPPPPRPRITASISSASSPPYYGNEDMSRMAADLINYHFPPPRDPYGQPLLGLSSAGTLFPRLELFIATVLHRSRLVTSVSAYFLALLYITRLKRRVKDKLASHQQPCGHALFITAYQLAFSTLFDDTYKVGQWREICQELFTVAELNDLTRRFCRHIDWSLNATPERLGEFQRHVLRTYEEREEKRGRREW
ncbi:hypothetical protein AURDEDRAFT_157550 [Auricularia subglabra TFB-10046 SS5]|nr:hypothetical protein AURDEDRAFT_157550 [Auricularia subglabra TFB-10046 SS5]